MTESVLKSSPGTIPVQPHNARTQAQTFVFDSYSWEVAGTNGRRDAMKGTNNDRAPQ